jgi:hypothetical protein
VEMQRHWHDREGLPHVLTDLELVHSLPYRTQGTSRLSLSTRRPASPRTSQRMNRGAMSGGR